MQDVFRDLRGLGSSLNAFANLSKYPKSRVIYKNIFPEDSDDQKTLDELQ